MLSCLVLSRLAWNSKAHCLLLLLTWLVRIHDARIFSNEPEDREPREVMKSSVVYHFSPVVKSDRLILDGDPRRCSCDRTESRLTNA